MEHWTTTGGVIRASLVYMCFMGLEKSYEIHTNPPFTLITTTGNSGCKLAWRDVEHQKFDLPTNQKAAFPSACPDIMSSSLQSADSGHNAHCFLGIINTSAPPHWPLCCREPVCNLYSHHRIQTMPSMSSARHRAAVCVLTWRHRGQMFSCRSASVYICFKITHLDPPTFYWRSKGHHL